MEDEGDKMKGVNFDEVKAGDLVQVPRYQFAPMRYGWNGWLFSDAVVVKKGIGRKSNKPVITVEMCIPKRKNDYETVERTFRADCVFFTNGVEIARNFLKEDGIESKEKFEQAINNEEITGADWIKFLIDKGFLF